MFTKLELFQKFLQVGTIDLSKEQTLDVDAKAIKQINFSRNLDRTKGETLFIIIEEAKKIYFRFFSRNRQGTVIFLL